MNITYTKEKKEMPRRMHNNDIDHTPPNCPLICQTSNPQKSIKMFKNYVLSEQQEFGVRIFISAIFIP